MQALEGLERSFLGQRTEHDHGTNSFGKNHLHRRYAIELWHIDVHGHNVRFQLDRFLNGVFAVAGGGDYCDIRRFGQQAADQIPHQRGVVRHQHANDRAWFHGFESS